MVKAVIFDLDDTLISERQYIESGYHHISKIVSSKFSKNEQEICQQLINLFDESSKNVFNRLMDKYGIRHTKDTIMELVEEYRNHLPDIEFYEDVLPCLEVLQQKGIKTGIITDGYANAQKQKLIAVKAFDYFNEIIITDELGREYWKPHPKAFEIMRDKLKAEFDEMVYVGDNPEKDFYICKTYPIKTVRIHREGVYQDRAYFEDIKETQLIYSLIEINLHDYKVSSV